MKEKRFPSRLAGALGHLFRVTQRHQPNVGCLACFWDAVSCLVLQNFLPILSGPGSLQFYFPACRGIFSILHCVTNPLTQGNR